MRNDFYDDRDVRPLPAPWRSVALLDVFWAGPELGHLPVHDFVRCCQPSGYSLCGISGLLDLSSHVFQLQGISEIHTFPDSNPGKHTKSVAHTQII